MPAPTLTVPPPSLCVTPDPLTPESFSPFGTAISCPLPRDLSSAPSRLSSLPPHDPAPILANQGSALKYSPISPLRNDYVAGACPSGKPAEARMSMFSCFPRTLRKIGVDDGSGTTMTRVRVVDRGKKEKVAKREVFDVRILERHPFTTQTFIPIDLSSWSHAGGVEEPVFLVVVAPTLKGEVAEAEVEVAGSGSTPGKRKKKVLIRDPPDLRNLKAFVARGGQAVTYGAGTWHAPMVVLGQRRVDFVVVQFANGVDEEDCQEVAFGEGVVVDLGKGGDYGRSSLDRFAKL
ncbi:hypothetical protein VTN00DRAFT_2763 [Thermoascus crustaceus]|uniref:uncharacterized protein n=1 Tax=Thermoascus crustaceus TaxID=5088 RepID=UPI0037422446